MQFIDGINTNPPKNRGRNFANAEGLEGDVMTTLNENYFGTSSSSGLKLAMTKNMSNTIFSI